MSKTLPVSFVTEKNKNATAPFNAVIVQFASGGVTLIDQAQVGTSLFGLPTLPIVKDWGRLDGVLNLREGMATLAAVRLRGLNHPGSGGALASRFSDIFPGASLESTVVSFAQCFWVGGVPGGTITSFTFFSGVIHDPVEYSETDWSFEVMSLPAFYLQGDFGVPLNQNDFPYIDQKDRGSVIPAVYGTVRKFPLVGLKARSATYPQSSSTNQSAVALRDVIVSSTLTVTENWTITMSSADAFVPTGFTTSSGVFLNDLVWNNSAGADNLLYTTDGTVLYKYAGGWVSAGQNAPASANFLSLGSFSGKLYAGGLNASGKNAIWRLDSSGWTAVFAEAGSFAQGGIGRLGVSTVRTGVLLAGAQSASSGNSILYSYNGSTTTTDRTQANNGSGNIYSNFADFNGALYVTEREISTATVNLLKWTGSAWTVAHTGASSELSSGATLFVFGSTPKLFAYGASGAPNHPKSYTWDGTTWSLDNDFGSHAGTGGSIVYGGAAYVFFNDGTASPVFSKRTVSTWSTATAMGCTGDRAVLYTNSAPLDSQLWVIGENAAGSASTVFFDDTIGAYAFTLSGSVTGSDGTGTVGANFVSNSLKIGIDQSFWAAAPGLNGDTITFSTDNSYFEYALGLTTSATPFGAVLGVWVDGRPDSSWQLLQNQVRAGQNCAVLRFARQKAPQLVNTLSGSGAFNGTSGVDLGVIPGLTSVRITLTPQGSPPGAVPYVKSKSATGITVAAGAGDTQQFDFTVRQDYLGQVTADVQGVLDDSSGTYTGVANALITRPVHVIHNFLRNVCAVPEGNIDSAGTLAAADAAMPSSYLFNGAVVVGEPLRNVVGAMLRQSRLMLDWPTAARLFFRPTTYATQSITKALTQAVIKDGSIKVTRTPVTEIINDVNVRYQRDFTKGRGDTAYVRLVRMTDPASISNFGDRISSGLGVRRLSDDLFMFDFVTGDSHASDLASFFLSRFKTPTRRVTLDVFLDQFELDRGDVVTISYIAAGHRFDSLDGSVRFLVERVTNLPGNLTRADGVRLICLAI